MKWLAVAAILMATATACQANEWKLLVNDPKRNMRFEVNEDSIRTTSPSTVMATMRTVAADDSKPMKLGFGTAPRIAEEVDDFDCTRSRYMNLGGSATGSDGKKVTYNADYTWPTEDNIEAGSDLYTARIFVCKHQGKLR